MLFLLFMSLAVYNYRWKTDMNQVLVVMRIELQTAGLFQ